MCCVRDIAFEIKCSALGIANVSLFDNKPEIVTTGSDVCKERPVTFTYWTKNIIYNDQITFGWQSKIRGHLL